MDQRLHRSRCANRERARSDSVVAPLVLLSGRVGRKAVICATLLVFTLGISTISLTPSLAVLALACFVCGLAESTNACVLRGRSRKG